MEAEDTCGAVAATTLVAEEAAVRTGEAIPGVFNPAPGTPLPTLAEEAAAAVGTTATRRRRITTARSIPAGVRRGTRNDQEAEDSSGPVATEMARIAALKTANGRDTRLVDLGQETSEFRA